MTNDEHTTQQPGGTPVERPVGQMAPKRTLADMAQTLREKNPSNRPMYLQWMAEQWWPDAPWLRSRPRHHNGGAKTGGTAAGGFAGRMVRRGLLRPCLESDGPRCYVWCEPPTVESSVVPADHSSKRPAAGRRNRNC
jgi:hypothetical protein